MRNVVAILAFVFVAIVFLMMKFVCNHYEDFGGTGEPSNVAKQEEETSSEEDQRFQNLEASLEALHANLQKNNPNYGKAKIQTFTGVTFGEEINKYGNIEKVDMSVDKTGWGSNRGLIGSTGRHELSYQKAEYVPEKPFRNFKVGTVYATWDSGLIYEVKYRYEFGRNQSVAADKAEYQERKSAMLRKYRGGRVETLDRGDERVTFKDDNVEIVLFYRNEGVIDSGAIFITATHMPTRKQAEEESKRYYLDRQKKETSSVKAGGEDAL